jgi:hypothetical protein
MKNIHKLLLLLFFGAFSSCVSVGPDGRPIKREPLPMAQVAGVYEGTGLLSYHRLELYPDGTGLWAACLLEDDENDPKVRINSVTSWKTVSEGIEGSVQGLTDSGEVDRAGSFKGGFLAGHLYIQIQDKDRSDKFVFDLMRDGDVDTCRALLKKAISKARKDIRSDKVTEDSARKLGDPKVNK